MTTFLSSFRQILGIQVMLCFATMAGIAQADVLDGLLNYYNLDGDFNDTAGASRAIPARSMTMELSQVLACRSPLAHWVTTGYSMVIPKLTLKSQIVLTSSQLEKAFRSLLGFR